MMEKITHKRWTLISTIILLIGAVWIWISIPPAGATTSGKIPAPQTGFLAPDFSLQDMDGNVVTLSDLKGTPILLNFWASWCPPCRREMPAMQNAYNQYKDEGFVILAINSTNQDDIDTASTFVSDLGITFPILLDTYGQASKDYQVRSLPTSFFIDQNGTITDIVIGGPLSEALLRIRIGDLLEKNS